MALIRRVTVWPHDYRIRRLLTYLDETPRASLSGCCRQTALSSSRLLHLFKVETGVSFRSYLRKSKMAYAARLLVTTFQPVKAIAYVVGYRHTSSFARAFAAEHGKPPLLYRLRCWEEAGVSQSELSPFSEANARTESFHGSGQYALAEQDLPGDTRPMSNLRSLKSIDKKSVA